MAARDVHLKDWRPVWVMEEIATDRPNSFTSPAFLSASGPRLVWKLIVRDGRSSYLCCGAGRKETDPTTGAEKCLHCLEFSLELASGHISPLLETELRVRLGDKERVFHTVPAHLHVGGPSVERPLVNATVTSKLRSRNFSYEALLGDLEFADFEFRVGKERISVHRCVFARFSEVFRAMFAGDMAEKKQGFVVLEDSSGAVMRGLRRFLYSGRAEEVVGEPWTYVALADKYAVQELKVVCLWELQEKLCVGNLCEWAVGADRYGLDELFGDCAQLLKAQGGSFAVPKEDWDRLAEEHKDVALRLLTHNVPFPDPRPPQPHDA